MDSPEDAAAASMQQLSLAPASSTQDTQSVSDGRDSAPSSDQASETTMLAPDPGFFVPQGTRYAHCEPCRRLYHMPGAKQCDGKEPCSRCTLHNLPCEYALNTSRVQVVEPACPIAGWLDFVPRPLDGDNFGSFKDREGWTYTCTEGGTVRAVKGDQTVQWALGEETYSLDWNRAVMRAVTKASKSLQAMSLSAAEVSAESTVTTPALRA